MSEAEQPTRAVVPLDAQLYCEDAVLKACHWLTGSVTVAVERGESGWLVALEGEDSAVALARKRLLTNVVDEELRARLQAKTAPLRALILAEAFSRTSVLQHDLESADVDQDPLGISQPDVETGRTHTQGRSGRVG